ncbi:hypothetical protein Tco_1210350 [Tanacetum coccineum]
MDEALVPTNDQVKIGASNMRIDPFKKQKEPSYQLTLDILNSIHDITCFPRQLIVELLQEVLQITTNVPNQEFFEPPPHDDLGMFYKKNVDYAALIWEDLQFKIDIKQTSAKRKEQMPYPRFTKKGKKKTPTSVHKEKKKDVVGKKATTPRKKSSITTDDNILPDPNEVLKLGESMSLTEVKIQDEERRVHETHAFRVTKKAANTAEYDETEDDEIKPLIQRSTGVVIGRDIPKESTEKALDHSQKLKGIETLSDDAQLVSDLKTSAKASKLDYRIQQQSQGSSEGVGIILEVTAEPKDISGSSSSSSSSSDNETKDISSNEEVKADEHKAEEGKKQRNKLEMNNQ